MLIIVKFSLSVHLSIKILAIIETKDTKFDINSFVYNILGHFLNSFVS